MSWWMNGWLFYTLAVSAYAFMTWAELRDERNVSNHYRTAWRESVERNAKWRESVERSRR